ncbi:23S rRNA (adenine(1618)-N(6))-methyltransferase RlmF [Neolewinella lacunae]|uniref:23S rRNA (Adenine(1618)-N(6))-methyltransferase RlmF n=1 Tax=Neolewinella lacunae TaxID=1517758 RepID=A0A923PL14_9BACT|nr:23S rRNA (adenine(1618)-N(6))-methyltransferase RlmF [Neolewinella lacunae]MBC6994656.1 23S rRNA (adenine(1618)-N(6))-methyltransferase RlmF [Neolewinella lacunae]MDN3634528.1 23S rRNA (adenine(1618)-N(6))-methyltransferase RlmF [Neolewinella lacunae]
MHPRNRYQQPHDFSSLAGVVPELAGYLVITPDGRTSLDFTSPQAVRLLNRALLLRDYGLKHWDIPAGNLCPGVPGRLDYIHVLADLLGEGAQGGKKVRVLDVGTGASLIYPILGVGEYDWRFVGTDLDAGSLKVAGAIARFNPAIGKSVLLRQQTEAGAIFRNVILPGETFACTMCNPPFFSDAASASAAATQKWEKLGESPEAQLNFGGQAHELWTPGGEPEFLRRMIRESVAFKGQVGWFTTLVSKKGYLRNARQELDRMGAAWVRELPIGQGGKLRRVLAWTFRK